MSYTLIDVANNVLLNTGERPLASLNSTIGTMVKNSIRTALVDVYNLSDWYWARTAILAESWVGNTATLPDTTLRVRGVAYGTATDGLFDLLGIPESEIIKLPDNPYSDATNRAFYFAPITHRQVRITPYPTTTTERSKIWFYVTQSTDIPTTDTGVFSTIPDEFMELVIIRASYLFSVARHGDTAKFKEFDTQYQQRVLSFRSRFASSTSMGSNMYKGWRRA